MALEDSWTRWLLAIAALSFVVSVHTAVIKAPPNYDVVTNAAGNVLSGDNPYAPQPGLDFFKYSPLFGLLAALFRIFPESVGTAVFLLAQIGLFVWGLTRFCRAADLDLHGSVALRWVAFFSVVLDLPLPSRTPR